MCDDENCIGAAAVAAELDEHKARLEVRSPHLVEHTSLHDRPVWPPHGHIVVVTRQQSEADEWREDDLRRRLREHQAEFGR